MTKRIFSIATIFAFALLMTSCHDESSKDGIPAKGGDATTTTKTDTKGGDTAAKDDHAGHNHAEGEGHGDTDMESMDTNAADLGFTEGSWGWTLQDYIANGSGTKVFDLDQVPATGKDDDVLSAEGDQQLNDLAELLKANPDMSIDVRCHSMEAKNGAARIAKKGTTGLRAAWVKTKLVTRGAPAKQITSSGLADEEMITGVAGDDASQQRITIKMTK